MFSITMLSSSSVNSKSWCWMEASLLNVKDNGMEHFEGAFNNIVCQMTSGRSQGANKVTFTNLIL